MWLQYESRDSIGRLPLPPSCLLPLGHTSVLRCQPLRVFSQIANSNYSPVFWTISFLLSISQSHIWFIFVFWSLSVVEFVSLPPSQTSPLRTVQPMCQLRVATQQRILRRRHLISRKEGITSSSLWAKYRNFKTILLHQLLPLK